MKRFYFVTVILAIMGIIAPSVGATEAPVEIERASNKIEKIRCFDTAIVCRLRMFEAADESNPLIVDLPDPFDYQLFLVKTPERRIFLFVGD
jgi:hypothetical protein